MRQTEEAADPTPTGTDKEPNASTPDSRGAGEAQGISAEAELMMTRGEPDSRAERAQPAGPRIERYPDR